MDCTYSLRVIVDFLESNDIKYKFASSHVGLLMYEHGCRIDLTDDLKMSIQTHPMIAGPAFAETAIQSTQQQKVIYGYFGYNYVIRHDTPKDLFSHIQEALIEAQNLKVKYKQ
jgi:hypothetical protein